MDNQAFREMTQALAHSQRELIQQNQQKQLVLDAASEVAIIATDLQGVITTFNRGAERMLGYAADDMLNRQTPAVFHDVSEMRSRGEELSRELGRPIEGFDVFVTIPNRDASETREWTYVRKDGQRLTVELVVTAARAADGRLIGYLGVATNITERKKAEMQRDRFFTLSLDMLCTANMSGYFVRLNPAFTETLGYTSEELMARPFLDFVHPDDKAATLEEVQKLSQGVPTLRFDNRYHCQDGSWKWLAWKAQPLPEEGLIFATARDITERKQIEEALRESEAYSRSIVESNPDCLKILTLDARLRYMTAAGCRLMEVEDYCAIEGTEWLAFWKGDEQAAARLAIESARAGGRGHFRGFCPTAKGTPKWWDVAITPIVAADGQPIRLLVVSRDITESKRIEEALIESEERLSLALKSGDVGTWSWDIGHDSLTWDDYLHSLHGLQPGLFAGRYEDFLKLLHPEDRECVERAIVRSTQEDVEFETEYRVVWTDGSTHVLSSRGKVYRNETGRPLRMTGVTWDMTEQRRNEAAIQQSDARNRAILAASLDAIITMDHQGRVLEFNPAAEQVFGYARDEAIGKNMAELIIPARLHDQHRQGLDHFLATGKASVLDKRLELSAIRSDGSEFPIELTVTQTTVEWPPSFTGFIQDITQRKLSESMQLEKEAALAASRAKSEFLATMSHELRTPLNGILGMNELLLNTELTDRQRQFVEACSTSGKALLQQINDILDLSKIEAGKLDLDLHECNLEALVYDIADVFSHSTRQKGYPLHCHIAPAACVTAVCDGNRLRQILVNLIGNAMKFTTSGSVTVRAECVRQHDRQLTLRFSVTDTGVGIPEDRRDRLFAPFSQVDSSTSRKFGGTGLGLSICKQLVELMGGQIGVESQLGIGSTFWFEVPLQLAAEDTAIAQRQHLLAGKRVLAVDGIDRERRQIGDSLQAWECPFEQVATLAEASEAIARAEAAGAPIAVVLADCRLVVGNEFALLQKLATQSRLPIVGLATNSDDKTISYMRQLGVRHVLPDPIRPSALFNAMTSVLAITSPIASPHQKSDATADEQPMTFSGHLLVAEDNHINQMFVRELLKYCGCTCDIADNGDAALTALQQNRYDLVLMDCQMPEMDGFTATREIRRREDAGELPGRRPIIALTANALKGDRERCLEVGMDDYLSKPLQAAQLQAMLAKFLAAGST